MPTMNGSSISRRRWLGTSLAAGMSLPFVPSSFANASWRIAGFRFDVTPPMGHPLCGGWITPATSVDDPLEAIGYVLLGAGDPIVVCSVDWTGVLNDAHIQWRQALAEAAGTTPDRVAIQCVHQHDAPFVCITTEKLLAETDPTLKNLDLQFFDTCLSRGRDAVKQAIVAAKPLTGIATSEAKVERIAGNRRLDIGADGKVHGMRGSASRDARLIAMPEGLIDPMLKTVAFYTEEGPVVACHYYACHPMSHYGKGAVSSDWAGLARKRLQASNPQCTQIYFNGCGGNVAAGKYNNGTPEARIELTDRMYAAMVESTKKLKSQPLKSVEWRTHEILSQPNPTYDEAGMLAIVRDAKALAGDRIRAAMRVGYLRRFAEKKPVILSSLRLDGVSVLHLPAECFVEYQLRAQSMVPDRFVATAAYGDGGMWYVPTKAAFPLEGYEVRVSNCAPSVDEDLTNGMAALLG